MCGQESDVPFVCPHWQDACQIASLAAADNVIDSFVLKLMAVNRASSVCGACAAWVARAVGFLSDDLDAEIEEAAPMTNPLRMQLHIESTKGRKRRYDEDVKLAVTQQVVAEKLGSSMTAYARHPKSGLEAKTVASWERRSLAWYTAATFEAFGCAQDISLAMDGSRLGSPAEETLLFAAFSRDVGKGCMPPPQVFL